MSDFRKWLIALSALALLIAIGTPAMAQPGGPQAFSCTVQSGTPAQVRVEGITELLGDLLLQCIGGVPALAGHPVPQTNITYTLNTNVTSRLLGTTQSNTFIDALLMLDEPFPSPTGIQNPPPATSPRNSVANPVTGLKPYIPQNVCAPLTSDTPAVGLTTNGRGSTYASPAHCNVEFGTWDGTAANLPGAPGSTNISPYATQANIFVGTITGANQVTWLAVPIDAPGTAGFRTIRITNVRGNACQLGLSSTLIPTQIVAFLSVTGQQLFTIGNPQQTVALIFQGLVVSGGNPNFTQCVNLNTGGGGNGGNFFGSTLAGCAETAVNVKEGFAQSFKRIEIPDLLVTSIPPGGVPIGHQGQNVPGVAYNTESAFNPTSPSGVETGFGEADAGTRILLRFSNVGAGVRLILPDLVPLTTNNGSGTGHPESPDNIGGLPSSGLGGGWTGGFIQLIGTSDAFGNLPQFFGFVPATTSFVCAGSFGQFGSNPFKGPGLAGNFANGTEVTGTGGNINAVYEVINDDPGVVEQANIPVGVAFVSNTANNLPAPGQTTVNASFAPLQSGGANGGTASGGGFIPRFCDNSTARNTFNIVVCQCNLLFPFVTNQAGFETGIAEANTTVDPYGTTPQTGTVKIFYFGNTPGNGPAPAAQTTQPVLPGTELIFTLSGGGNYGVDARAAGFQGYIITIANFQFCHAFAFINDTHSSLSEGYVAIQLDIPGLNRTGIAGENEGH